MGEAFDPVNEGPLMKLYFFSKTRSSHGAKSVLPFSKLFIFVEIMMLYLVKIGKFKFSRNSDVWLILVGDSEDEI